MKICLATVHQMAEFLPLALLYLKAYLVEERAHAAGDVATLEFPPESQADDIVSRILATEPAIVGLSCYVWNVRMLTVVARRLRDRRADIRIVLGGPEVGPVATSVLQANPAIDVVVKSEGEIPFAEIVQRWSDGSELGPVAGICYRDVDEIIETDEAPVLRDLNHIPSPHLHRYGDYRGRIICLETQRGCVFRCNFCFYNKDLSIRNRRFDLERVEEEIFFWLQQDISELYLMDPIFNLNAERAKAICRFIVQHNHRNIPCHAEIWAEFVDEELAHLMHQARFHFLEVGLQSTDPTALATVERRLKLQRFIDGITHLKHFKLEFEVHLIHGLPGDTAAAFRKSLNFAYALDAPDLAVFRLMILPGTELWRKADDFGLTFEPDPPYFVQSHRSMSVAEIDHGRKIADAVDQLQHSRTLRLLCREPMLTFADLVDEWIAWVRYQQEGDPVADMIQRFIGHVCDQRQIPSEFYRQFASLEFGQRHVPEASLSSVSGSAHYRI